MSNNSDYTITTLSNGLKQRKQPVFSLGGNNTVALREKCSPYTVVATEDDEQKIVKFPFGIIDPLKNNPLSS